MKQLGDVANRGLFCMQLTLGGGGNPYAQSRVKAFKSTKCWCLLNKNKKQNKTKKNEQNWVAIEITLFVCFPCIYIVILLGLNLQLSESTHIT